MMVPWVSFSFLKALPWGPQHAGADLGEAKAPIGSGGDSNLMLLSSWGVVLESLVATPQSASSIGSAWSVGMVEIESVWFLLQSLEHRVPERYKSVDDPYINQEFLKKTINMDFLFLLEDQSKIEGRM